MKLEPGAMVTDKVRLEAPLREGGMGVVWSAHHLGLDIRVAVKFVLAELSARDATVLERFEREAKAAARIKTPHVVHVFDHGVTNDGMAYIVMELLEGNTLAEWLLLVKRMTLRDSCTVVSQVASVLEKAHYVGIVHRDIKPGNIFLVEGERDLFVKVLDFGVAKTSTAQRRMTAEGALIGTPSYMSPEQVTGAVVDHHADLWALAVMAYEMLTGDPPFDREDFPAMALAICAGSAPPVSERLALATPPELDDWFACAFSPKPEGRFNSAEAMARAFESIVDDLGETAMRPTAPDISVRAERPAPRIHSPTIPASRELELAPSHREPDASPPLAPKPEPPREAAPPPKPAASAAPKPRVATAASPSNARDRESLRSSQNLRDRESLRSSQNLRDRESLRSSQNLRASQSRPSVRTPIAEQPPSGESAERMVASIALAALVCGLTWLSARLSGDKGRAQLDAWLGGAAAMGYGAGAIASLVAALRVSNHHGCSESLKLATIGLAALGLVLGLQALAIAVPTLELGQFQSAFALAAKVCAACVPLGFGLFAAGDAMRANSEDDTLRATLHGGAALIALVAAIGAGAQVAGLFGG
jgi:serine/threonine-protein kinase